MDGVGKKSGLMECGGKPCACEPGRNLAGRDAALDHLILKCLVWMSTLTQVLVCPPKGDQGLFSGVLSIRVSWVVMKVTHFLSCNISAITVIESADLNW